MENKSRYRNPEAAVEAYARGISQRFGISLEAVKASRGYQNYRRSVFGLESDVTKTIVRTYHRGPDGEWLQRVVEV